ncbi:MAG: hypothetical protein AB7S26_36425 [Sandaracinaceae bacterium]
MHALKQLTILGFLVAIGCSDPAPTDAGPGRDDAAVDAATVDGGTSDGGTSDGGAGDAGACAERFQDCSSTPCCGALSCVMSGSGTGDGGATTSQCG